MKKFFLPISLLFLIIPFFLFKIVIYAVDDDECDPNMTTYSNLPMDSKASRIAPCNLCMPRTPVVTNACATTFTIYKNVSFPKNINQETIDWSSRFNVDVSGTSLPFAGKTNEESEDKYLADYLEGTNEYYSQYGNQTTLTNYQGVLRKLTPYEYQNQLKKSLIARVPESDGDDKEQRIHNYPVKYIGRFCWDTPFWMDAGRYVFNEILNLIINSPIEIAKDILIDRPIDIFINKPIAWINKTFETEIKSVKVADLDLELPDIGHYCLYADKDSSGKLGEAVVRGLNFSLKIPGLGKLQEILTNASQIIPGLVHFSSAEMLKTEEEPLLAIKEHMPPDPNLENYREEFLNWKNEGDGKWYRLWQVVPLITREDAIGEVMPYTGEGDPDDLVNYLVNYDYIENEDTRLLKVPHLARLYEASKIVNNLLFPTQEEKLTEEELPRAPEISEFSPPTECFKEDYLMGEGDDLCCGIIPGKVTGTIENPYFAECADQTATTSAQCLGNAEKEVVQDIGLKLSHPFLDEIWRATIYPSLGFFNVFRPHTLPIFEDIDAASTITYSGEDEVSPQEGLFFYPHLGGVQKAKEWVVNQALKPYQSKK